MARRLKDSAARLIPNRPTLPGLRAAAAGCRACDLWKRGSQTVFGEGSRKADLMRVGEQFVEDLRKVARTLRAPREI